MEGEGRGREGEGGKEAGTDATTRNQKRRKMQKVNGGSLVLQTPCLIRLTDGLFASEECRQTPLVQTMSNREHHVMSHYILVPGSR